MENAWAAFEVQYVRKHRFHIMVRFKGELKSRGRFYNCRVITEINYCHACAFYIQVHNIGNI